MQYTWNDLLDPNNAILIAVASGTILYGSHRSNHFFSNFRESFELDNSVVKTRTAIIMPIVGSIFLLLLFYFLDWLKYLLIGIMALSSLTGFAYVVYPFFDLLCNRLGGIFQKSWEVRWVGCVTISGIITFFASLGIVIAWLVTFYFVLVDVLAISLALTALSFVRLPNLKVSLIILILFFLYDIFWVFISPFIFKTSVMVDVAMKLPILPMVVIFPKLLSKGWSLLGVGDIVMPGLFLCFLYRFDTLNKTPFIEGYFLRSWLGYIVGLVITLAMLLVLQKGQPALLYLVPCILIPAIIYGLWRGELKKLWNGIAGDEAVKVEEGVNSEAKEENASLLSPENEDTKQV